MAPPAPPEDGVERPRPRKRLSGWRTPARASAAQVDDVSGHRFAAREHHGGQVGDGRRADHLQVPGPSPGRTRTGVHQHVAHQVGGHDAVIRGSRLGTTGHAVHRLAHVGESRPPAASLPPHVSLMRARDLSAAAGAPRLRAPDDLLVLLRSPERGIRRPGQSPSMCAPGALLGVHVARLAADLDREIADEALTSSTSL